MPINHKGDFFFFFFFTVKVVKHWNKVVERACGVSILEGIQNWTGHVPEEPVLCFEQEFGLDYLQR